MFGAVRLSSYKMPTQGSIIRIALVTLSALSCGMPRFCCSVRAGAQGILRGSEVVDSEYWRWFIAVEEDFSGIVNPLSSVL